MLEQLFTHPRAASRLRSSPLGPWLDSFVERLTGLGYTPWSCRSNVVLAADLGRWMAHRGISVGSLNESGVEAYVEQRQTQRERRRAASSLMLAHLQAKGVTPPPPDPPGPVALEQRYAEYMVEKAPTLAPKTLAFRAGALRSFFRFVFLRGETATDLTTAPLTPQTRHRGTVPRYLSQAEVGQLLDTCDVSTPTGRRNLAILLLLVRLGLRASEVAALELDDIRWRSGEIVVRGKGDSVNRLPLLTEVGEALSAYLKHDRVCYTPTRRVFLRRCAPVRELGGRGAISSIVRKGLSRAGLHPPVRGAHLLRHTLGTQMIRAGASMAEIAEVLRHATPSSSAVYAKVDFEALRALARPWPEVGGAR